MAETHIFLAPSKRRGRKTRVEECWILTPSMLANADPDRIGFRSRFEDEGKIALRPMPILDRDRLSKAPTRLGYVCRIADGEAKLAFATATLPRMRFQTIALIRTKQRIAGERIWFQCECGTRAAKIYLPYALHDHREAKFACRGCFDLSYRSAQTAHQYERSERRRNRVLATAEAMLAQSKAKYRRRPACPR